MKLNTPYYIIHKKELDENFKNLKEALEKHWNNYIIGYSYKTNALPWIIKHFYHLGCYAEVVSEEEYDLAKLVTNDNKAIIYNGPIKTKDTFIEALGNDCIVNIDSQREIEWLSAIEARKKKVGIRVNFDIEKYCPGQSQCPEEGGRFGFCYENRELEKAIDKIKLAGAEIIGIHLHTSSKSRGLDVYRVLANVACELQERFGLDLEYVDIGGGFFGGLSDKPQFGDYFALIESILSRRFDKSKTKIIIEPGMSVIGAPISYVTTVIDVKETNYNRFVITDGSRTNIDPFMTKSSYFHSYETENEQELSPLQIICGYTCMEHDRLYVAKNEPCLKVGDRVIYYKVGAYTMCLTPLFIKYLSDVYLEENGEMRLIRKAWKPREYIVNSIIEE